MASETDELLAKIKQSEMSAKRRALLLTIIPLIVGISLLAYASAKVIGAEKQVAQKRDSVAKLNLELIRLNGLRDSLSGANRYLSYYVKDTGALAAGIVANQNDYQVTPKDSVTKANLPNAYRVERSIRPIKTYWVYIGQGNGNTLQSSNFYLSSPPRSNSQIVAKTPVYKRDADPQSNPLKDWKLGKIVGVVDSGQTVQVISAKPITGGNWWAEVQ